MKNAFESTKLATIMLLVILYPYHMCTGVGSRRLWHQMFGTIVFPCKRTNLLRVRRNISTVKHFSNYLFDFCIALNLVHPRGICLVIFSHATSHYSPHLKTSRLLLVLQRTSSALVQTPETKFVST